LDLKLVWVTIEYLAADLTAVFTVVFVLQYCRHENLLTPYTIAALVLLPVVDIAFVLTNNWHHLIWLDFSTGPEGTNLLYFHHGWLYYVTLAYQTLLFTLAIVALGIEAIHTRGVERFRAVKLTCSIATPLLVSFTFALLHLQPIAINMMPVAFAFSGLLVSWIMFEDVQLQAVKHSLELEDTVHTLQDEICTRRQLEDTLCQTQESLADRLADQNRRLVGVYNLILMAGELSETTSLLQHALDRIHPIIGSDAICILRMGPDGTLNLEEHSGLPATALPLWQQMAPGVLDQDSDVRVDIDTTAAPDFPQVIAEVGFGATMFKRIPAQAKTPALLGALWSTPRSFSVEEIALFSALADGLGLILENARLRVTLAEATATRERARMSHNLHDSVSQSLHSMTLSAENARHMWHTQPEGLDRILSHIEESASQALKEMRLMVYELQESPRKDFDFLASLQSRLHAVERRAGVKVQMEIEDSTSWPGVWERDLYLMATEALNNALKHARAQTITVQLRGDTENFNMRISDDGCGFDPGEAVHLTEGTGLRSLAERADRLGGRLEILSEPGKGTNICFRGKTRVAMTNDLLSSENAE
jgi:signal transduction histidine kinase